MPVALNIDISQKNWEVYQTEIENLKETTECNSEEEAIAFARTFCYTIVKNLWNSIDYRNRWKCRQLKFSMKELDFQARRLTKEISDYFITLNIMEYAYLLGNLYTMLLPDKYRSDNGIYYTPPSLAERLLDLLAVEGADWAKTNILDPACGGGAFLVTVANRMLGDYRIRELSSEGKLIHIEEHLAGIELDKFAAWLTQCLLDIIVYPESIKAGRRLKSVIKVENTIQQALIEKRRFDVIVGNPPYGRVKLDEETRKTYARSLFGHANLYGLFIDASLRLKKKNGLVGFVTPTSFLGGKYFSNLRKLLVQTAPPLGLDFVSMRNGVFDKVLQETCLVVFGPNPGKTVIADKISVENNMYSVERIGSFKISEGIEPWVIAREPGEAEIINRVKNNKNTLKDYGYKVSTGQLVWNRLKSQICESKSHDVKPIIWAEAITADGEFNFKYRYRKKLKYITINEKQKFLTCNKSVVLVQRTTSKEQNRRLQSCVLPKDFVEKWNGVVVENHVNIIHPLSDEPIVSLEILSLLLNSQTVDKIFRCLSGSVAVSATELQAIPLPPVANLKELEELIISKQYGKVPSEIVEIIVKRAYGLEDN